MDMGRAPAALRPLAASNVDAADFAGIPAYQPTSPVAASAQPVDDIRPPQPGLYTPAPQPQQTGFIDQLGEIMQNPLGPVIGAGGAILGRLFGRDGRGMFGGDPALAARSAAIAGGVSPSDRIGGAYGGATYGRKQSDGSVTGTTRSGTGWSSSGGGNEVTVGGKTYRRNRTNGGYSRVL